MFPLLLLSVLPSDTGAHTPMEHLIPTSAREWNLGEKPVRYPGMKIFDYMDGAGEVYRAYDFSDLLVARYQKAKEEEILVEVFDMGSAANAFGVFSYMKGRGPIVPVGQEGEYKNGLLSFWKGRHFVCVKTDGETPAAREAILELGSAIDGRITERGAFPDILSVLPENAFLPATLRYFFRDEILNIHYYVGDGNLFQLGRGSEGVLVRMSGDRSVLLLIRYGSEQECSAALAHFAARYMPEASEARTIRAENGLWTLCRGARNYGIVVFDAPNPGRGEDIIASVKRRLP